MSDTVPARPLRVAEIAPPWLAVPPTGYGGVELVVALLADGLVERGHDVTLFATGDSRTRAKLRWVFERAPGPGDIESIWHDSLHTLFAFRSPGPFDVVHVHAPFSALAAAVAAGRPVVHTLHGPFTPETRRLYSLVADCVWFVAISEAQRSAMPELRYAGVVHNGIDVDRYPFRSEKEDFVLFLGRAAPEKGPRNAAIAARATRTPLVMAVKVADAVEQEHWSRDVQPVLPADAVVLEEVDFERKVELLSRARALLFPIDWDEPFGLVMAEALACGTPVLATPRGAAPEVVADGVTGFVLPVEGYADAAAEAVRRLGEIDPRACRRRAEERFSRGAMVRGYERAFEVAVRAPTAVGAGRSSRPPPFGTSSR